MGENQLDLLVGCMFVSSYLPGISLSLGEENSEEKRFSPYCTQVAVTPHSSDRPVNVVFMKNVWERTVGPILVARCTSFRVYSTTCFDIRLT